MKHDFLLERHYHVADLLSEGHHAQSASEKPATQVCLWSE